MQPGEGRRAHRVSDLRGAAVVEQGVRRWLPRPTLTVRMTERYYCLETSHN